MRTNFAERASKELPELMPEYAQSVGPIYKMMSAASGQSESDPRKIAKIVVSLTDTEEVPKRLILGKNAAAYVEQVEKVRAEETAKYCNLTLSTGFTGTV